MTYRVFHRYCKAAGAQTPEAPSSGSSRFHQDPLQPAGCEHHVYGADTWTSLRRVCKPQLPSSDRRENPEESHQRSDGSRFLLHAGNGDILGRDQAEGKLRLRRHVAPAISQAVSASKRILIPGDG
jgi:hypothetical protein